MLPVLISHPKYQRGTMKLPFLAATEGLRTISDPLRKVFALQVEEEKRILESNAYLRGQA